MYETYLAIFGLACTLLSPHVSWKLAFWTSVNVLQKKNWGVRYNIIIILFPELCDSRLGWDQPLSGASLSKWQSLISDLEWGPSISIPRCFLESICQEVEVYALHGFCDVSKDAYAAVVYLVMKTTTSQVVKFVTSKTRVSPIHKQTISRLELLSALLLAKLMNSITGSLEPLLPLSPPTCYE